MIDIKTALTHGHTTLLKTSPSSRIDAEMLLLYILKQPRTYLYTHPETLLTTHQWQAYQHLIHQRSLGHPVAYLTQSKEFWSLPLMITEKTLIPRPETELLVELTITLLNTFTDARILDLGTGSGAIALALASERPTWHILAIDDSEEALEIARHNASNLNLNQIKFLQSNWFTSITKETFHAIISNPPYIAENDIHLQQGDIRFEPRKALTSGINGLDALNDIIKTAITFLLPGGFLLVEHGFDQKEAVAALFQQYGYVKIQSYQDIVGNDRVTGGFRA